MEGGMKTSLSLRCGIKRLSKKVGKRKVKGPAFDLWYQVILILTLKGTIFNIIRLFAANENNGHLEYLYHYGGEKFILKHP